jgi:prevent-host-death family protein
VPGAPSPAFGLVYNCCRALYSAVKTITCTELKNYLRKYLRAVQTGQSFLVTYRGEIVAKIGPVALK